MSIQIYVQNRKQEIEKGDTRLMNMTGGGAKNAEAETMEIVDCTEDKKRKNEVMNYSDVPVVPVLVLLPVVQVVEGGLITKEGKACPELILLFF